MKAFFIHNMDSCIGCCACQVACKDHHRLHSGDYFRRVTDVRAGGKRRFISLSCGHCEKPLCLEACPFGAYRQLEDGTVIHDDSRCIGCGRCLWVCPYGEIILDTDRGIAQKCDGCYELRKDGREPVCVAACINGSLSFGVTELPEDELSADIPGVLPDAAQARPRFRFHLSGVTKAGGSADVREPYYDYLILGAGIAGVKAAECIRKEQPGASVCIVEKGKELPYIRPLLTKMPMSQYDHRAQYLHPEEWYAENRIELRLGEAALRLRPEEKLVETEKGLCYYGKCIYALGAESLVPPIPGRQLKNVFTLRTAEDLFRIKRCALKAKTAVIIGGGVIGMETAAVLNEAGISCTVLEAAPYLIPRVLDEASARKLQESLKDMQLFTGVEIAEICGHECAEAVLLKDGRRFEADLVVISCGNKAASALAAGAGLQTERGIPVNGRMETACPDVYACGDCTQFEGRPSGMWDQALLQAETAALNACEKEKAYIPPFDELLMNLRDLSVYAAGDLGRQKGVSYEEETEDGLPEDGVSINRKPAFFHERRFYRDGRLCGVFMLGRLSDIQKRKAEIRG